MSSNDELGCASEPLCREPWESYYVLRRGILPCCYGSVPIAPMSDWRAAWNSPEIREIRRYLARGKLAPYCRASLGCPVVQRHVEEQRRSKLGSLRLRARRLLAAVNRLLGGVPSRTWRGLSALRRGAR